MKVVTEERLKDRLEDWREAYKENDANIPFIDGVVYALDSLVNECKELTPWQPIETAPKDREIILYHTGGICCAAVWCITPTGGYWSTLNDDYLGQPTHWQELPGDPK